MTKQEREAFEALCLVVRQVLLHWVNTTAPIEAAAKAALAKAEVLEVRNE